MERLSAIAARLGRLLALAERALEERVGAPPTPGLFERHLAFRWEARSGPGRLQPIEAPALFDLEDLVGVERAVARLLANVEQFVLGLPANHVLLFGERGTGKSSAVRGLLPRFAGRGLRIVEVHKDDLLDLPRVLAALRGAPHRFLLFCDDLSFDAGDPRTRELKSALEGSLVAPPENVRIIATSNRRHLLPESAADNRAAHLDEHGELHVGEALDRVDPSRPLRRLRSIVEQTAGGRAVLFLLDEILHGTNSHDRRIGAEAVVRSLVARGAIGLVTTHDLALAQIADDLGARAANLHFEDQVVEGTMRFDYRMRPGVVTRSNALALMRAIGLEVSGRDSGRPDLGSTEAARAFPSPARSG